MNLNGMKKVQNLRPKSTVDRRSNAKNPAPA
jgi:hypothetical protein